MEITIVYWGHIGIMRSWDLVATDLRLSSGLGLLTGEHLSIGGRKVH